MKAAMPAPCDRPETEDPVPARLVAVEIGAPAFARRVAVERAQRGDQPRDDPFRRRIGDGARMAGAVDPHLPEVRRAGRIGIARADLGDRGVVVIFQREHAIALTGDHLASGPAGRVAGCPPVPGRKMASGASGAERARPIKGDARLVEIADARIGGRGHDLIADDRLGRRRVRQAASARPAAKARFKPRPAP